MLQLQRKPTSFYDTVVPTNRVGCRCLPSHVCYAIPMYACCHGSTKALCMRQVCSVQPRSGHSLSVSSDPLVPMLLKMDPWTLLEDHRLLELSDTLFSASRKRRRIECADSMDTSTSLE